MLLKDNYWKLEQKIEKFILVFVNIYAPVLGPERIGFIKKLNNTISILKQDEYMFMGGYFNCTANDKVDRNHKEPHILLF